ncbi:nitroreductase [Granulosicoccus antarcticus]|uniref:Nitroreductase NfnB n=1 Tax=Granulosicoccus antarcticus IMCC3135 TaxID=1192854 RepID=A0A2Z2NID9_9GAMM|nr:nitroreductase [Granulosicoccus antarcticus]ASJ70823.1 Nitroreductase NfnB [Granulosicoccus antarcticus IMCC3135]
MSATPAIPASFDELLSRRRSVRGFLPEPISQSTVADLLISARTAPSGANLQPGEFHVLTGSALASLTGKLDEAMTDHQPMVSEYSYFPDPMPARLKERQRAAGYALYDALGIAKRDVKARREQFRRNYQFFNAPVGIVVSIQRDMGKGCFMDLGMALMAFFLAAQSRGLATSGIGALANHADVVHDALDLDPSQMVVCGIALGKPDPTQPVNQCRTTREPLENYAWFKGFEE